jgi:purine nucleosidase
LLVTRARLARMKTGNPVARAAHDMLAFPNARSCQYGKDGAPLHDPCTMAWLLVPGPLPHPRLPCCHRDRSPLTLGHSVVDFWNVEAGRVLCNGPMVDADGFFDLLFERLARFSVARVP